MVLSEALTPVLAASLRANPRHLRPRRQPVNSARARYSEADCLWSARTNDRLSPDITESTVKVHVKHMLKKMKLKSRVEAVWVHQERIS